MKEGADGIVVAAPIWRNFMNQVLGNYAVEQFPKYEKEETGKPILDGKENKEEDVEVCKIPGTKDEYCLASDACPSSSVEKKDFADIHDILYYVKKDDPRGDYPKDPSVDPQYKSWEKGVQEWFKKEHKKTDNNGPVPTEDCTKEQFADVKPDISLSVSGDAASGFSISADVNSPFDVEKVAFSVDGDEIASMNSEPYKTSYTVPSEKQVQLNLLQR
jgi:hypothetical protein